MSKNPIDPVIERFEKNAAILRQFRDLLERDPSLIPVLREALNVPGNGRADSIQASVSVQPEGTLFDRAKAYFGSIDNAWQTTTQLREALNASRGAITGLIYQNHKDDFEPKAHPISRKLKLWRLKPRGGGDSEKS